MGDLTDQGTPLPPNLCGCFGNSARLRLEKKLRVENSPLEQEIGKTLYRVGKRKKRRKKTDFEILKCPEDRRMLKTISKEIERLCSVRHVRVKNLKGDHVFFPGFGI